jgi:hypothetical protein
MMVLQPDVMPIRFGIRDFRQRRRTFQMSIIIQSSRFDCVSRSNGLVTVEAKTT